MLQHRVSVEFERLESTARWIMDDYQMSSDDCMSLVTELADALLHVVLHNESLSSDVLLSQHLWGCQSDVLS